MVETTTTEPEVTSAFIEGVVDRLYNDSRIAPDHLDDDEQIDWLSGWDA